MANENVKNSSRIDSNDSSQVMIEYKRNDEKIREEIVPFDNGILNLALDLRDMNSLDITTVTATGGIAFDLSISVSI